jgi:hypothetical protein
MTKHFFFGAFFLLFLSFSISAQTNTNQTTTQTETEPDETNSDIVITATVKAKELKMEIVPTPKVEFPGTRERQTIWEADREDLPAQIQPGVVYKDIGVRLRIYSRFSEIQRIVIEAIDEINSPTDTTQTTQQQQQTTTVKPPQK